MRVLYREQALRDIEDLYRYLEKRCPSGARNVLRAIYAGIQFIAEHPKASEVTDDPTVRVKVMRRYRYKISTALLNTDAVEVLHIRHTSRRAWQGERD